MTCASPSAAPGQLGVGFMASERLFSGGPVDGTCVYNYIFFLCATLITSEYDAWKREGQYLHIYLSCIAFDSSPRSTVCKARVLLASNPGFLGGNADTKFSPPKQPSTRSGFKTVISKYSAVYLIPAICPCT